MFKTCIENRIAKKQYEHDSSYKCYTCNEELLNNKFASVQKHIATKKHFHRMLQIDETVKKYEMKAFTSISESLRREIVDNGIAYSKKPHTFTCHMCNCTISDLSKILDHIYNPSHRKISTSTKDVSTHSEVNPTSASVKSNSKGSICSLPPFKNPDHVSHITQELYKCNICQLDLQGIPKVETHLDGNLHKANFLICEMKVRKNDCADESAMTESINKRSKGSIFTEIRFCKLCKTFLKDPLMVQCHVMLHLHAQVNFPSFGDIIEFSFKDPGKPHILCLLCKTFSTCSLQLYHHVNTENHLGKLKLFTHLRGDILNHKLNSKFNVNDFKIHTSEKIVKGSFCNICFVPVKMDEPADVHENGEEHKFNATQDSGFFNDLSHIKSETEFLDIYICFICHVSFSDLQMLFDHYNQVDHRCRAGNFKKVSHDLSMNFIQKDGKQVIHCTSCDSDSTLLSLRAAIEHMAGRKHWKDSGKVPIGHQFSELKLNDTEFSKNYSKMKSIPQSALLQVQMTNDKSPRVHPPPLLTSDQKGCTDVNNILHDLVKLDLSQSQQRRLSRSAQMRKLPMSKAESKSSSFSDDIFSHGKVYIDCCIEAGKMNIYNVDEERMRLLNLGLRMTLIYSSNRYCFPCRNTFPADEQSLFEHLLNKRHIESLYLMETDHKEFDNNTDEFSDLKLAHMFMEDTSDEWIKCYACNIRVKNEDTSIDLHSKTVNHIRKSQVHSEGAKAIMEKFSVIFNDLWFYAQLYSCKICKKKFDVEIKFVKHLLEPKHLENISKIDQVISLRFDACPICTEYWYGSKNAYSLHCEDNNHKYLTTKRNFLVSSIEDVQNIHAMFSNLNESIQIMVKQSDEVNLQKFKELEVLRSVEDTVKHKYPKATAYIFGSRISYLGTVGSDVDIFLDCEDNKYSEGCSHEKSEEYLISISGSFENEACWTVFEILTGTRVPIIKLRHEPTGLNCDISFSNGLSVEKSKLLGYYNAACSTCRQLTLYMKKWLKVCHLSGPDCITTFAISWYVIFYLQVAGIFPPVSALLKQRGKSKIIDGWECNYAKVNPVLLPEDDFRGHLKRFFSYYADFDYRTDVACPFLGYVVKKVTFAHTDQLPEEMQTYKLRAAAQASDIFRFDSPMCIQDPIDLSQNSTKGVKKFQLRQFRQYCSDSVKILSKESE